MKSWKTTLASSITSAGMAAAAAPIVTPNFPPELTKAFIGAGAIMSVVGNFFHGLFARDADVSSEQQGLHPTQTPAEPAQKSAPSQSGEQTKLP